MEKNKIDLAPIALFVYNRPGHARLALQSLKRNVLASESLLYIFVDGPKANAADEQIQAIEEVKKIIRSEQWCKEVIIREAVTNKGLANSLVNGVNEVVQQHGKIIVLEDDLVSDIYFLEFMNKALALYDKSPQVACISAYIYPVKDKLPDTFFIKGADCWGWATWKQAWEIYNSDSNYLLQQLKIQGRESEFDFDNSYPYVQMLKEQVEGKNNSWAVRWYASAFLQDKFCLYPGHSLIKNIGNDGSGTHAGTTDKFDSSLLNKPVNLQKIETRTNEQARDSIVRYFNESVPEKQNAARDLLTRMYRKLLPAGLRKRIYQKRNSSPEKVSEWSGDYTSWQEVSKKSTGYNESLILEKVKQSLLKVKNGQAAYERDSVAFETLEYSSDLLRVFKEIAAREKGELNILDFGGSLGTTYYQYRSLLKEYTLSWSVVEQEHFVDEGKKWFANEELAFYKTIRECVEAKAPSVLLLSSVLAYLPEPHEFVKQLLTYNFTYLILYRTAFIEGAKDRLTLQSVPPSIYSASYPSWFFNEENLLKGFGEKYTITHFFKGDIETELNLDGQRAYWKGIVLKLK